MEEFLSMAALIFGIAGAVFLSGPIGGLLDKHFGLAMWSHIIAFLGCFIIIYIIIKILEGIFNKIIDKLNLENLDRALGFVLGLFEGFLVVAVLVFLFSWLKWIPFIDMEQLLKDSFIARFIQPLLAPITQTRAMIFPDYRIVFFF